MFRKPCFPCDRIKNFKTQNLILNLQNRQASKKMLCLQKSHNFKCTNAVIKTMLCFSYILFTIFCDVVYYVSIHFCPGFNCLSWMKWWFLCMRKTDGSSVFLLFSYVIFLILCKLFLLYFTLYGLHVYIHIFVHTMEACNKDYYHYYHYHKPCRQCKFQTVKNTELILNSEIEMLPDTGTGRLMWSLKLKFQKNL